MTALDNLPRQVDKIFYSRCPVVPTSSSLAYQLGLLQDELAGESDVDVDMRVVALEPNLHPAPQDRLWLRHAGHPKALWARSEGADTQVVAFSWVDGSYPIVALAQAGIDSPADLRGKRLAVARIRNTPLDIIHATHLKSYETALATADLTLADVKLVDYEFDHSIMQGPQGPKQKNVYGVIGRAFLEAMMRGEVDAAQAELPGEVIDFLEVRRIYDTKDHPALSARVNPSVLRAVVVSGPLMRERRDLVVRIVARLLAAGEWATAHPGEVGKLVADDLRTSAAKLTAAYGDLSRGVQIDVSDELVGALRVQKDFLLRHGFVTKDFSIDNWVDRTVMRDARQLLSERVAGRRVA
jgi:ABC-type nitrate/sulfonate/bicarbonate transport system substrate-binding protein